MHFPHMKWLLYVLTINFKLLYYTSNEQTQTCVYLSDIILIIVDSIDDWEIQSKYMYIVIKQIL